jgi:hypothetical protein
VDPGQVDRHGQQGKGLAKQALTSLHADAGVTVHPFSNGYWAYLGCRAGVDCTGFQDRGAQHALLKIW